MGPEAATGWAALAQAGPEGRAAFAVIVLACLAMALRGVVPGAALAALLRRRPPE
jgi:hypothetical protein